MAEYINHWRFWLECTGRYTTRLDVKLHLNPDSTKRYRAIVACSNGKEWGALVRDCEANQDYTPTYAFMNLESNTRYQFTSTLETWDESAQVWWPGAAKIDTSVLTSPEAPTIGTIIPDMDDTTIAWTQPLGGKDSDIKNIIRIYKAGKKVYESGEITGNFGARAYSVGELEPGEYTVYVLSLSDASVWDYNNKNIPYPQSWKDFVVEDTSHPAPTGKIKNVTYQAEAFEAPSDNYIQVNFRWDTTFTSGYVYGYSVLLERKLNRNKYNGDISEREARKNVKKISGSSCPVDLTWKFTRTLSTYLYGGDEFKFKIFVWGEYDYGNDPDEYPLLDTYEVELLMPVDHYPEGTLGLTIESVTGDTVYPIFVYRPDEGHRQEYTYNVMVYISKTPHPSQSNYVVAKLLQDIRYRVRDGDPRWDNWYNAVYGLEPNTTYYIKGNLWFTQNTLASAYATTPTSIWSNEESFTTTDAVSYPELALWDWDCGEDSWNAKRGDADPSAVKNAKKALDNKENTRNFHHTVWNDLVKWIQDAHKKSHADGKSSWADGAAMTKSSRVLTSVRWNYMTQLYNNAIQAMINDMHYYIDTHNTGQEVLASYFYELVERMNYAIAKYKQSHS